MFIVENENTVEPVRVEVLASLEARLIMATFLLTVWGDNPGMSDHPETWQGGMDLAQGIVHQTMINRLKLITYGISVQWVTSTGGI